MLIDIKAIDIHSHFNFGHPKDSTSNSPVHNSFFSHLEAMNAVTGIEKTFTSSFASVIAPDAVLEGNTVLQQLTQEKAYLTSGS